MVLLLHLFTLFLLFFFSLLSLSLFGVFARIAYHTTSILMDKQKKKGGEKVVLHFI